MVQLSQDRYVSKVLTIKHDLFVGEFFAGNIRIK